jgi:hypothetical protein
LSYLRILGYPDEDPFEQALQQARSLFQQFHSFGPGRILRASCDRRIPGVVVRLGKLKGLIYTSDRGQCGRSRTFVHFMETPPMLAANAEGTQLYILGGRYRVTRKGIVG